MATESLPRTEAATCESRGVHRTKLWRQEESIKASTRCQPHHAAKKRGDNEAHSVEQESDKQVNNTA